MTTPTPLSLSHGACAEERARVRGALAALLSRPDVLILDTETTGLKDAEVIEVALIDAGGRTRLNTLVQPKTRAMNPYAQRVHGISLRDLAGQPTWPEVLPELVRVAGDATILAWNAPFDARMLEQTSARWGLPHPKLLFVCAMRLYARFYGRRSFGLHKAVAAEGLEGLLELHTSHRALGDVTFVLELLRHLTVAEHP
jgi:DNA polymerase III subunit epsilon